MDGPVDTGRQQWALEVPNPKVRVLLITEVLAASGGANVSTTVPSKAVPSLGSLLVLRAGRTIYGSNFSVWLHLSDEREGSPNGVEAGLTPSPFTPAIQKSRAAVPANAKVDNLSVILCTLVIVENPVCSILLLS